MKDLSYDIGLSLLSHIVFLFPQYSTCSIYLDNVNAKKPFIEFEHTYRKTVHKYFLDLIQFYNINKKKWKQFFGCILPSPDRILVE